MLRHVRYVVLAIAMVVAAPIASAGAQTIQFGLTAGASLSTFTGDLVEDAKNYSSFIAGAFVYLEFAGFGVQPGVYYTRKGAKLPETEGVEATNALSYIQIPLVLKLGMPLGKARFYVGGGPAIGIKVSCKFKAAAEGISASTDCEDIEDETFIQAKSTEMSGIAVAGHDRSMSNAARFRSDELVKIAAMKLKHRMLPTSLERGALHLGHGDKRPPEERKLLCKTQ